MPDNPVDIALVSQPMDLVVPPSMNSIGIWTNETARILAQTGQRVTVYARRLRADQAGIGGGVRTRLITSIPEPWMRAANRRWRRANVKKPFFASPLYYLDYAIQVALDLRRSKTRVAHIQNFSQFAPIIRAINPGITIGLHMRCEWLTQLDERMIERRLRQVDRIFGISDYITEKIRQRFPHHAHKCSTVMNAVDVDAFCPPDFPPQGERHLLMIGRVSPEKGVHVMLEAFPAIARRFPDAHLDLVGSLREARKDFIVGLSDDEQVSGLDKFYHSPYIDQLRAMLPEDLRERVHFVGPVDYAQTLHYYRQAYLLVNSSLSESFGRSLIEANACGVPVVAARTGGMTSIIEPGLNGLLVPAGDPAALAVAITQLLEDPALRHRMSVATRQRVLERFTWASIARSLLEAYHL